MESLLKVPFGNTDLKVTKICVGGAPLGGMPYGGYRVPEAQAIETLIHIFNSPIRFLDTASIYEESELRIGKAINEFSRLPEDFVIATKADRDPETGDFSAEQIMRSVDKSQRLLGIEQLPIVYLHDPEQSFLTFEQIMSPEGPVAQLHKLQSEGVIGHIGIAGGPVNMMIKYVETGAFEAVIIHNRFTLMNRSAVPLIEEATRHQMAVVNSAIYNGGILAKSVEVYPHFAYRNPKIDEIEKVKKLENICKKYQVALAAAALQFSLRNSRITSTVVGVSSPEEVDQTLALAEEEIPPELWKELENFEASTEDPERI